MKTLLRLRLLLLLPALSALTLPSPAQITFTVTATAENTPGNAAQDYIAGEAYTFVYTLTPDFPLNHTYFLGENNDWFEKHITNDPALFTHVGGSGLGGDFSSPVGPTGSPFSFVRAYNGNFLGLFAGADVGNIGVTTLAGSTLTHAIASMNLAGIDFGRPEAYTNPASYFESYVGDYQAWGGSVGLYGGDFDGATFQVTGVNIAQGISNTSAVPEPATYAALLGLAALGVTAWRRRPKSSD